MLSKAELFFFFKRLKCLYQLEMSRVQSYLTMRQKYNAFQECQQQIDTDVIESLFKRLNSADLQRTSRPRVKMG